MYNTNLAKHFCNKDWKSFECTKHKVISVEHIHYLLIKKLVIK